MSSSRPRTPGGRKRGLSQKSVIEHGCLRCKKKVDGSYVPMKDGGKYHVECFYCSDCNMDLTSEAFRRKGNLLLCREHYHSRFSPKCDICNTASAVKTVMIGQKRVHMTCLSCKACGVSLPDPKANNVVFTFKDEFYCYDHQVDNLGQPCIKCGDKDLPERMATDAEHTSFAHKKCVTCTICKTDFREGEEAHLVEDKAYCQTHYEEYILKQCFSCGGCIPTESSFIKHQEQFFHTRCFKCSYRNCTESVDVTRVNGLVRCRRHVKLAGVNCHSCGLKVEDARSSRHVLGLTVHNDPVNYPNCSLHCITGCEIDEKDDSDIRRLKGDKLMCGFCVSNLEWSMDSGDDSGSQSLSGGDGENVEPNADLLDGDDTIVASIDPKFIAKGAFGKVFRATTKDGQTIALKEICPKNEDEWAMVWEEIRVMRLVNGHPNIVRLLEARYLREEGKVLLAMEWAPTDLHRVIESDERISPSRVKEITRQLLEGVMHCHSQGVIHKDIKSLNVLLTEDGDVKLCDFGSAETRLITDGTARRRVRVHDPENITPHWSAPEVLDMEFKWEPTFAADIWSVACVVIEMITLAIPFADRDFGDGQQSVIYQIVNGAKPTIPEKASANLEDFLAKCFWKAKRRPSASDLLAHPWLNPTASTPARGSLVHARSTNSLLPSSRRPFGTPVKAKRSNSVLKPVFR